MTQEEIDALLQQAHRLEPQEPPAEELTEVEKDVLGEIGNISMGTAATALSQILNHKVTITAPRVEVTTPAELFRSFKVPYVVVTVEYTAGLAGHNLLIMKVSDAAVIADLMMGGGGSPAGELDDMALSAVAEAMNQMIGSAATSMSSMFARAVAISPPKIAALRSPEEVDPRQFCPWEPEDRVAVVYFRMTVEGLVDSELLQVIPVPVAKQEVSLLLQPSAPAPPPAPPEPVSAEEKPPEPPTSSAPPEATPRNLDLLLDIPLEVSVIMGRTKRPIKEILALAPGSVVELDKLVDEPVEILVNGTLVAEGEVVVVNENFGVRITHIISPAERIKYLR